MRERRSQEMIDQEPTRKRRRLAWDVPPDEQPEVGSFGILGLGFLFQRPWGRSKIEARVFDLGLVTQCVIL